MRDPLPDSQRPGAMFHCEHTPQQPEGKGYWRNFHDHPQADYPPVPGKLCPWGWLGDVGRQAHNSSSVKLFPSPPSSQKRTKRSLWAPVLTSGTGPKARRVPASVVSCPESGSDQNQYPTQRDTRVTPTDFQNSQPPLGAQRFNMSPAPR